MTPTRRLATRNRKPNNFSIKTSLQQTRRQPSIMISQESTWTEKNANRLVAVKLASAKAKLIIRIVLIGAIVLTLKS